MARHTGESPYPANKVRPGALDSGTPE